jgi:hypothetical protein
MRQVHPRIQRRRDLASSLNFPPELKEAFGKLTGGELAVVKIISDEVVRHGTCTLSRDAIAALACTSRSVMKAAFRAAKAEGLLKVAGVGGGRGRCNTITLSAEWKVWLDRHGNAPRTDRD